MFNICWYSFMLLIQLIFLFKEFDNYLKVCELQYPTGTFVDNFKDGNNKFKPNIIFIFFCFVFVGHAFLLIISINKELTNG